MTQTENIKLRPRYDINEIAQLQSDTPERKGLGLKEIGVIINSDASRLCKWIKRQNLLKCVYYKKRDDIPTPPPTAS